MPAIDSINRLKVDQRYQMDQWNRVVYDPEGAYAVLLTDPTDGTVTLQVLEATLLGTYRLSAVRWVDVDASDLNPAPLRASGSGYVLDADLEDRPRVVAEPSLHGFVVPDHPDDEFEEGQDDYARSTHESVRAFDAARPTEPGAKRYKSMVGAIEARERARMDEARFLRGRAAE